MNFNLPPVGGIERSGPAQPARGAKAPASSDPAAAVTVDTLPASPPDEVLEAMSDAAKVAEKLYSQERELHFEPVGGGRVVVQVRDLDGNVLRTIPPTGALDVASGKPLD
jgi:flagellar protein FlaG